MAGKNQVTLTFAGDADQLAKASAKASESTKKFGADSTKASKDATGAFAKLNFASVGLATGIANLGDTVDDIKTAWRSGAQRADDLARAQLDVRQAAADVEQATGDAEQAQLDYTQSLLDTKQASLDVAQASRDVAQAGIDVEQAQLDAEQAQRDYNDAVAEHGAGSLEARQASLDLRQAQEDLAQANEDLRQANLDSEQATADATQAQMDGEQAARDQSQALLDTRDAQIRMSEAQRAAVPPTVFEDWLAKLTAFAPLVLIAASALQLFTAGTVASTVASNAAKAATAVWTGIQWLLNAAFWANPIVLIVAGIVALIAVIVLIATKTDWFQRLWAWAWGGIKKAAMAVGRWFTDTLWPWLKGVFDRLAGAAKSIPKRIKAAFSGLFSILTWPFRTAFNFVVDAWNNTIGRLSWTVPSWVPFVGGNSVNAPVLPHFHTGGVASGAMGGEFLAVLRAGEEVRPAGGGPATTIMVERGSGTSSDQAIATLMLNLVRNGTIKLVVRNNRVVVP